MSDKVLEHLKDYLQMLIDSGQHKIFYNDLMHEEKTIDCINAITNLQQKYNFAENILYDYLYKDRKITKELYDKFKK